ncbi:MAG: GTP cyclohydrolase II, partial [Methylococcaceae bacterium]|nr:GTP cyclohydrolase II [Methylococcaceae bacterium]
MSKPTVSRMTCARIPTKYGDFQLCYYTNTLDKKEHLAFYMGDVSEADDVLVRIHSECFTGDV